VTNLGPAAASGAWSDGLYLSTNAEWDADDEWLGTVNAPTNVAAGQAYAWTNEVTLPAWPLGMYYLILKADDGDAVPESTEANNTQAVPVTFVAPDLAPVSLRWTGTAVAGEVLTLTGTVTNLGAAAASPTWDDAVYLSEDAGWDDQDEWVGAVTVEDAVAAHSRYTWTNEFALPYWDPGAYYLILKTDDNDELSESNETNNTKVFPLTLTEAP